MRCPHCHAKNPDNTVFCVQCDGWILGPVYQEKTSPPRHSKLSKFLRKRWLFPTIASVCVLAIVITVLLTLPALQPQTEPPLSGVSENHIQHVGSITPYTYENQLCFISNDTFLETEYSNYRSFSVSLDGRAAAVLTEDLDLLYIRDDTIRVIGQNVQRFILSVNGDGVAFLDNENKLARFHREQDQPEYIYPTTYPFMEEFAISPDGNTVAYFVDAGFSGPKGYSLFIHQNGESVFRFTHYGELRTIISVSDNGELVYMKNKHKVLCVDADGFQKDIGIALISSGSGEYITISNADHNQLLFFGNDGTYLSDAGQPATKISPKRVYPVAPALTDSTYHDSAITYSCYDLTEQIFYDYSTGGALSSMLPSYNLWRFSGNNTCQLLIADCYSYWIDPTGRYVFYNDGNSDLCVLDSQSNAYSRRVLASNVTQYTVAYDCSTVYYAEGKAIYSLSTLPDSQPQLLSQGLDSFVLLITNDNRLCVLNSFTEYFRTLFICKDGKLERVMGQVVSHNLSTNGMLYVATENAYYLCAADGMLTKLHNIDALVPKPLAEP